MRLAGIFTYLSGVGSPNGKILQLDSNEKAQPVTPSFDASAITSGILPAKRGGTENGFTKFSGPNTSEKTFTLPNESATLFFGDGGTNRASAQTTDGTITTLHSFTIPDGKCIRVWAVVQAMRSDNAAGVAYVRTAVFRRNGGTTTQIGTTRDISTEEDSGEEACDCTIDNSGSTIRVQINGRTSTTFNWRGHAHVSQSAV